MFRHVAGFELRYQLTSAIFWGTFLTYFLLTFAMVASDDLRVGWGGQVYRNAPYAVTMACAIMSVFAIFIATAFVSSVVLRDEETRFGAIIHTTQLSKFDYLFGRFAGAFVTACLAFSSVPLGAMAAVLMPGLDPETIGPFRLGDYLYVYFVICVPSLFFLGALFFALSTATRSIMATYVGALVALAVYLFLRANLSRPEFGPSASLFDPFALGVIDQVTSAWTPSDRNTLLPPFVGLMLQNRAIWCGMALVLLGGAWLSFALTGVGARSERRVASEPKEQEKASARAPRPLAAPTHRALGLGPLVALTGFEVRGAIQGPAFVVLLGFAFITTLVGLWLAADNSPGVIYPVTRVMVQTLLDQFTTIPLFIAAFYAGELVWRDRERRVHEIIDATPTPDWAFLAPKILAVLVILLAMGLVSIGGAISVQLLKGFTALEISHYFTWYLTPWFITMALYAVLAIFVQTLVPHKFVGLLVMLLYFILQMALPTLGFEDNLYIYAETPATPLSDMNGQGAYAGFAAWYRAYWSACAVILVVLSYGLWRRGASAPLGVRLKNLPRRLVGSPGLIAGAASVAMAALGGHIYYNTHVLNEYRTFLDGERWAANYERTLLPFNDVPQPRISDVTLDVDIYPRSSRIVTRGRYVIENRTAAPLAQVNISWPRAIEQRLFLGSLYVDDLQMRALEVEGARLTRDFPDLHHRIYTFETPMAPGERREVRFETVREQRGFRNSNNDVRVVGNGTFIDNWQIAPWLGVPHWPLLKDRATRRRYGLPEALRLAQLGDESARAYNYLRRDSDWVNADITISTDADQVAFSAGELVETRLVNDRRVFRFRSEAPIVNFVPIMSGRYEVRTDAQDGVDLAVYYHSAHTYNVDRMIDVMKSSIDYYTANFGPYQFRDLRVVEVPAYSSYAQAFPGIIPYSESVGFVMNVSDVSQGIDYISYVLAHEIGHEWWAHQIVGADMQGSTALTETLAQYSSLMVMEKRYGAAMIRRFLESSLDNYLSGRGNESAEEPPLDRVEDQAYVRYDKGGYVLYLLRNRMGEEAVNRALRSLLQQYAFRPAPYPSSSDLVAALRAEATPEDQQLITDLFQRITLYDLSVADVQSNRRPDGRWGVTVTVEAHKNYADGRGRETEAPLDEVFDIGVFSANPGAPGFASENVLAMQSQRLRSGRQRVTLTVDREPAFVGLDPYIRYIDRNPSNNVVQLQSR